MKILKVSKKSGKISTSEISKDQPKVHNHGR
jgi:hypothetical protein